MARASLSKTMLAERLFGEKECGPVCFGHIYGHDRYTALLPIKVKGFNVIAQKEALRYHK